MPCYRLFHRHPHTGRFMESEVMPACADDREALARLADHLRDADIELWERDRLVAVLRSVGTIAPSLGDRSSRSD